MAAPSFHNTTVRVYLSIEEKIRYKVLCKIIVNLLFTIMFFTNVLLVTHCNRTLQ